MTLTEKYDDWIKTLFPFDEERIIIWLGPGGIGDKISTLPAFRHLKKLNPDKKIVLFIEPLCADIWKYCKYIDYTIPETYVKGDGALAIYKQDLAVKAWWSFYEHHLQHICKSSIIHICNVPYTDDIPLEYELSIWEDDIPKIESYKNELLEKSNGKKIIGIAPTYTMYSRMWSKEYWIKLTKLLQENGYFVVSLGGNNDLKITTLT